MSTGNQDVKNIKGRRYRLLRLPSQVILPRVFPRCWLLCSHCRHMFWPLVSQNPVDHFNGLNCFPGLVLSTQPFGTWMFMKQLHSARLYGMHWTQSPSALLWVHPFPDNFPLPWDQSSDSTASHWKPSIAFFSRHAFFVPSGTWTYSFFI